MSRKTRANKPVLIKAHEVYKDYKKQGFVRTAAKHGVETILEETPLAPFSDTLSKRIAGYSDDMARGKSTKRSRRWKKQKMSRNRGSRVRNPTLQGWTIPFKHVYLWKDMSGSAGCFYKHIGLKDLLVEYEKTFDEFKLHALTCRFIPNNAVSATGVYVAVLLDQNGFGDLTGGTEVGWFRSLASMVGSKVQHRDRGVTLVWYPTEPDSRNWWRYQTDSDRNLASLYFCDNAKETVELGGCVIITGKISVRGMYWNAPTLRARRLAELAKTVDAVIPTEPERMEDVQSPSGAISCLSQLEI